MSPTGFLRLAAHIQMMPVLESGEETLVGGQAVMEGVMMRAPHSYCVAVRKPSGEIVTEEMPVARMSEKYPLFKYPVLRGLGTLGQAMSLGNKGLALFGECGPANPKTQAKPSPKKSLPGCSHSTCFSRSLFLFSSTSSFRSTW